MILPALTARFQTLSAVNAALIGGAFVLFCIAVYLLKKLTPLPDQARPHGWPLSPTAQRLFGVLFGVAMTLFLAHQLGYLALILEVDDRVLGAGESSAFFVFAPGAWLGLALIYVLVLSSTAAPRFDRTTTRFHWMAFIGLLGVNGMAILVAAELNSAFAAIHPLSQAVVILLLLYLLFLPPRLVYQARQRHPVGLISFSLLLAIITLSDFIFRRAL